MRENNLSCAQLRPRLQSEPHPELSPQEESHLADCDACMDLLLAQSLDEKPPVAIPSGFPARVAANLPALPSPKTGRQPRYGRRIGFVLLTGLVAATSFLALVDPHWFVANSLLWLAIETLAAFEVGALAIWLMRRDGGL